MRLQEVNKSRRDAPDDFCTGPGQPLDTRSEGKGQVILDLPTSKNNRKCVSEWGWGVRLSVFECMCLSVV